MENITPKAVRDAATQSLTPLSKFVRGAGVGLSTFYRWEAEGVKKLHPVVLKRLTDAVAQVRG